MSDITEKLYGNLRHNFHRVVREVLGESYYDTHIDVYDTPEQCARDLIREYDRLKDENKRCTGEMIVLFMVCLLSIIFNMYLVVLVMK